MNKKAKIRYRKNHPRIPIKHSSVVGTQYDCKFCRDTKTSAPHWDMNRKASIEGLSFDSTKNHIIRAAVESVPYQIKDVIVAMEADSGTPLTELKIDGGITSNKFVVQFLADLLNRKVSNIEISDVSALGAGYLAGLNAGVYKSIDQLKTFNQHSTSIGRGVNAEKVKGYYEGWKRIVYK